jgi:hypothetical protein
MAYANREVHVTPSIMKKAVTNCFRCVDEEGQTVGVALMELSKVEMQPKTWAANKDDKETLASLAVSLYHTSLARIVHKYARDNQFEFKKSVEGVRINAYGMSEEDQDDDEASLERCYEDASWCRALVAVLAKDVKWLHGFKDHPLPFYADILDWLTADTERNSYWDRKAAFYRASHDSSKEEIIEAFDLNEVSESEIYEMVAVYAEDVPTQFKESTTSNATREDADVRTRIERAIDKVSASKYGQLITKLANLQIEGETPEDTQFSLPSWVLLSYNEQARQFAERLASSPAYNLYKLAEMNRQQMEQLEQLTGMLAAKKLAEQINETQQLIENLKNGIAGKPVVQSDVPSTKKPHEVRGAVMRGPRVVMGSLGAAGFHKTGRA